MKRPDNNNPLSSASRFRQRRFKLIESIIERILLQKDNVKILDVGGRQDYWNLLNARFAQNVSVTLLNYSDELRVGQEVSCTGDLQINTLQGDGCSMPEFDNVSFDIAHSNSTIEHVGSLQNMYTFAQELQRVGNAYYVQTPYLWFPLDPHYGVPFVHWLPGPTRALLLHRFNMGYSRRQPDYLKALAAADHTQIVDKTLMRELFPDGTLVRERFAWMTKSLVLIRQPAFD